MSEEINKIFDEIQEDICDKKKVVKKEPIKWTDGTEWHTFNIKSGGSYWKNDWDTLDMQVFQKVYLCDCGKKYRIKIEQKMPKRFEARIGVEYFYCIGCGKRMGLACDKILNIDIMKF